MNSTSIAYGKVEVRAKLPRGDWLWPAIWMLPKDNKYGPWPLSGEIDVSTHCSRAMRGVRLMLLWTACTEPWTVRAYGMWTGLTSGVMQIMEARGNAPSYPAQGVNYVRSSLNYGVLQSLQTHIFGWWSQKQSSYDKAFHVYAMEWTPDWMRFYVDSRLQAMINLKITGKGGKDFFKRGDYPATATNGSNVAVVVENIWEQQGGSAAAPFDQGKSALLSSDHPTHLSIPSVPARGCVWWRRCWWWRRRWWRRPRMQI